MYTVACKRTRVTPVTIAPMATKLSIDDSPVAGKTAIPAADTLTPAAAVVPD
jgi:hypothetical protein